MFVVDGGQRHASANILDVACEEQAKAIGFASILTIGKDAALKSWKCHGKGKGKNRAGVAVASMGVGIQPYMPMELPSSRETHLKAMVVSLETTNAILPSSVCADPILPLAATLAIFRATLDSPSVAPYTKVQVAEAGNYLAEWLA